METVACGHATLPNMQRKRKVLLADFSAGRTYAYAYCLISSMAKHSKMSPSLISLNLAMVMPHS